MLSHPNDPRNLCAESLYPFPLWFPEWEIEGNWLLARGNSRHFAPPPLISPRNEGRNSILMTCHYQDLSSASDWLSIVSQSNSSSDGSRENKETERETPSLALGICEFLPKVIFRPIKRLKFKIRSWFPERSANFYSVLNNGTLET